MTQKFARHKITIAGLTGTPSSLTFWFLAPENTYQGLPESDTGVEKIAMTGAADATNEIAPICTVEALLKSGFAVRKVIAYTTGTAATLRRRYAKVIVAKNKAAAFSPTGDFRGGTIRGVVNPLDAKFS
jgi:hypothetical protein